MDEPITYPKWSDVGIPPRLVECLHRLRHGNVLDYLIFNRVFRFQIKAQYVYTCGKCSYQKRLSRNYESYLKCERCKSELISSTANWRMGKDRMQCYSNGDGSLRQLIQQMSTVYGQYFRDYPPDEFLKCDWALNKDMMQLPQPDATPSTKSPRMASDMPSCAAEFCCGDRVVANDEQLAICKAALLCPFLWDDTFDWKWSMPGDKGREKHILPLLNLWARLENDGRSDSSHNWATNQMTVTPTPEPYQHIVGSGSSSGGDDDGNSAQEVPAAVMEALNEDPALLEALFNNGDQGG